MALSNGEITRAWQAWVKASVSTARPALWSKAEMIQVVQAVDAWDETKAAEYNAALPAFFRTGGRAATADEKRAMLAVVEIMKMTPAFRQSIVNTIGGSNG